MTKFQVNELTPHPRNNEFFDDMTGEKWTEFLQSIKSRGVIEPIVITSDKVIVSGHQRVRACKELGIKYVMCDVHAYDNEDQVLQDLIETNVRQRGDVGGSAKKIGKRIKELERIYGIRDGSYGKRSLEPNNSALTQSELADKLGISVDTLQNYKLLAEMIPEMEELLLTGIVSQSTVLAVMRNLDEEQQLELIASLDTTKKITKKECEKYIDEIKKLKENPPVPSDYESTKKELNDYKLEYKNLVAQFQSKVAELQDLRKQMENMKNEEPVKQYEKKLKDSVLIFCSRVSTFIEQVGGYVWLTDKINEIPELEREGYIRSVHAIKAWAETMEYNLNNNVKELKEII